MHGAAQNIAGIDGSRRRGFTLVEVAVASFVVGISVAMAMAGFMYLAREIRFDEVRNRLDIDVQTAVERVKYDMRLSSLEKMFFYPDGAGPYSAVSFPMARDSDGDGAVDLDEGDNIVWNRTIIYHVWDGEPNQLRRTVFEPRNNALSDDDRAAQLRVVSQTGSGENAINGGNAQTDVVFENLFFWKLMPRGAAYDGYAAVTERDRNVLLGSCVLSSGPHAFTFEVTGKHDASSGYQMAIDSLFASPCAIPREAEGQLPASVQYGAEAAAEYRPEGSWSGNHRLVFPATQVGQSFVLTLDNDCWEETNFSVAGDTHERTSVTFDPTLLPPEYIVRLNGPGTNWSAEAQSGDSEGVALADAATRAAAFRVLLRGEEMAGGNWLEHSSQRCRVCFRAGPDAPLGIAAAYIGEAASTTNSTSDVVAGTQRALRFGGTTSATVPAGNDTWSDLCDLPVEREKSYLVTFLAADTTASAAAWRDVTHGGDPTTYLLPAASGPDIADCAANAWSTNPDLEATNLIVGVAFAYGTHPASGAYTSRVLDTGTESPAYTEVRWQSIQPEGTVARLRVRTGDLPDLSDALPWSSVPVTPAYGLINPGNRRYVQFRVELDASLDGLLAPQLHKVRIEWEGPPRVVEVGGTFGRGPDHGIFRLTVDGKTVVTGVTIDLEIYDEVRGRQGPKVVRSRLTAEVEPRNTGM